MDLTGITGPQQIAILTKVLDDHCRLHAITGGEGRDAVARRILALFIDGLTTTVAIEAALDRLTDEDRTRRPTVDRQ